MLHHTCLVSSQEVPRLVHCTLKEVRYVCILALLYDFWQISFEEHLALVLRQHVENH